MSILDSLFNDVQYGDEGFKSMLEDHMTEIANDPNNRVVSIKKIDADRFEGDFYSLMRAYSIPDELQWITMRINKLKSPGDYRASMQEFYIPDYMKIKNLYSLYTTSLSE